MLSQVIKRHGLLPTANNNKLELNNKIEFKKSKKMLKKEKEENNSSPRIKRTKLLNSTTQSTMNSTHDAPHSTMNSTILMVEGHDNSSDDNDGSSDSIMEIKSRIGGGGARTDKVGQTLHNYENDLNEIGMIHSKSSDSMDTMDADASPLQEESHNDHHFNQSEIQAQHASHYSNMSEDINSDSNESISTSLEYETQESIDQLELKKELYARLSSNQPTFEPVYIQKYQWWNKGKESKSFSMIHFQYPHLAYTYIALHLLHDSLFLSLVNEHYNIPEDRLSAVHLALIDPDILKSVIVRREQAIESENEGVIWKVFKIEECFSVFDMVALLADSSN